MSDKRKRYILPEEEIPHYWYNIQADMVNKPISLEKMNVSLYNKSDIWE